MSNLEKVELLDGKLKAEMTKIGNRKRSTLERTIGKMYADIPEKYRSKKAENIGSVVAKYINDDAYEKARDIIFEHIIVDGVGLVDEDNFDKFFELYGSKGEVELFQSAIGFYLKNLIAAGEEKEKSPLKVASNTKIKKAI